MCTPGPHNVNSHDVFMLSGSVPSPCPTQRGHAMPNVTRTGELDSSTWWWGLYRKRPGDNAGQASKTAVNWVARGRVVKGEGAADTTTECSDSALFLERQMKILAYSWPGQWPGSLCGLLGLVLASDSGVTEPRALPNSQLALELAY